MSGIDDKPAAIRWLEEETGEEIPWVPEEPGSQPRHLSVRLSDELATAMDTLAAERNVTASQLVRDLLADAWARRNDIGSLDDRQLADRLDADMAEVRRRLLG
ncbi:MAG: CopG family transcriptional regulator [Actinomycetota bacterium]|nr:CopG family transcriptional regulator [Actinomycetota bacterium]